jgi:hypothetical protein
MATTSIETSIFQDLGIAELILGDIAAFSAGQPVTSPKSIQIGGQAWIPTVQVLPNGPTAPFVTVSGGIMAVFSVGLELFEEFSAGASIALAFKFGKTWYGFTLAPEPSVPSSIGLVQSHLGPTATITISGKE